VILGSVLAVWENECYRAEVCSVRNLEDEIKPCWRQINIESRWLEWYLKKRLINFAEILITLNPWKTTTPHFIEAVCNNGDINGIIFPAVWFHYDVGV
jgi:hypothetical protein